MQREHDPEPQRYYDWMSWKMRQEDAQQPKVITQEELWKREMAEMQHQVHHLQMRVKELTDAILQLQKQRD